MLLLTLAYKDLCESLFSSFRHRSGIAESYGNSMFNFSRDCQTFFLSSYPFYIFMRNGQGFQFLYIPSNRSFFFVGLFLFVVVVFNFNHLISEVILVWCFDSVLMGMCLESLLFRIRRRLFQSLLQSWKPGYSSSVKRSSNHGHTPL